MKAGVKVQNGSIVYARAVNMRAGLNGSICVTETIKGVAHEFICEVIGLWKRGSPLPTREDVVLLKGALGWVASSDIIEALGEDAWQKVAVHVANKYQAPAAPADASAAGAPRPGSGLSVVAP